MLTKEVAQQIVGEMIEKLGRNVNIMNGDGMIIASGDPDRVGTIHEGSLIVLRTGKPLIIHEKKYLGSKPGINLPITLDNEMVGVVGITGEPREIAEFGSIVVTMTELMLQRAALQAESEWKERLKGFLLDECLKPQPDEQKILHKTKLLNIDWCPPYNLMVFHGKNPLGDTEINTGLYRQIAEALDGWDALYDFIDDESFVVMVANIHKNIGIEKKIINLFKKFYKDVQAGIGDDFNCLSETREKYGRIIKTMRFGREEMIYTKDYRAMLLLESTEPKERQYFLNLVKRLSEELRMTLKEFFKNDLNISQTAQSLFIHRNTMIYRLEKITEITGKDPRNFRDAWELQCGLWLDCLIFTEKK